jgi:Ras-related protein Rab-22
MQGSYREVKVVFRGDGGVGKTSILNRFYSNQYKTVAPTIGASFVTKNVNIGENVISFQIWDTAGQEKYRSIASLYYRDAAVAILVYDITNKNSFEVLKFWRKQLSENGPQNLITVIVGNKMDLVEEEIVSYQEAKTYADSIGALFRLTSAKDNKNISDLFTVIGEQFIPKPLQAIGSPMGYVNNVAQPQQFQSTMNPAGQIPYQPQYYSQGSYPNNPANAYVGAGPGVGGLSPAGPRQSNNQPNNVKLDDQRKSLKKAESSCC